MIRALTILLLVYGCFSSTVSMLPPNLYSEFVEHIESDLSAASSNQICLVPSNEIVPLEISWFWSESCFRELFEFDGSLEEIINLENELNSRALGNLSFETEKRCDSGDWNVYFSVANDSLIMVDAVKNYEGKLKYIEATRFNDLHRYVFKINNGQIVNYCSMTIHAD